MRNLLLALMVWLSGNIVGHEVTVGDHKCIKRDATFIREKTYTHKGLLILQPDGWIEQKRFIKK